MNDVPSRGADDWIRKLRVEAPLGQVIDLVLLRLRTADGEEQYDLAFELVLLLEESGRHEQALEIVDQMIETFLDDVRFPIMKSSINLHYLLNYEEALMCIDAALKRAYRTGCFRREALGVKARILLQLERGEQLSAVLDEIMSVEPIENVPDVGRERDFVDRAPPGLIEEEILIRYNQFRPRRDE
ncbi:MAG: hypothetical protein QM576_21360 [Rhodopseudomonas sp.]|uniref:hypothetical protein n=1 Tax=Rhodopseudomonas sp. TaxID=1078 RepID=UPI0039E3133B